MKKTLLMLAFAGLLIISGGFVAIGAGAEEGVNKGQNTQDISSEDQKDQRRDSRKRDHKTTKNLAAQNQTIKDQVEESEKILHQHPVFVIDAEADRLRMPKSFRTTKDTFSLKRVKYWVKTKKKLPSRKGMERMSASASEQFSELSFRNLLKVLEEEKKLYVIDLRQENHAFANGHAVSLYGRHNASNQGLTEAVASRAEKEFIDLISRKSPAHIYKVFDKKEGEILQAVALRVHPAPVMSEQQLVESYGARYKRFRVLDHSFPDIATMDAFIEFVKSLPEDAHLHFHCRGGRGRASQFMIYYDILMNGSQVDFDDILDRQYLIGNKRLQHVSKLPSKAWKKARAEGRFQHLSYVYEYAKDPEGYKKQSWTAWLASKGYDKKTPFVS